MTDIRRWIALCEQAMQGHLPLTRDGRLYHTTSTAGAYDILAQHTIRPGQHNGSRFVSFSERPLINHPDIAAAEVCIGFSAVAFAGQIDPVQYTEAWYDANRDRAAYVAGEGWYQQWEAPEDAYDDEGFEDEDIYNAAHRDAELDAFLDKVDEHEWVSHDQSITFKPRDVMLLIVRNVTDWQQNLAELGYAHVRVQPVGAATHEGRVYRIDWGYTTPVMIIRDPSKPQSRTLVAALRKQHSTIYLRGLMLEQTVYIWDGWNMTHDDVHSQLMSDVPMQSDDLVLFEIADYTPNGVSVTQHRAKCSVLKYGSYDPASSPFVRNVMNAIDETAPPDLPPPPSRIRL